jgi:hypothetical protein
MKAIINGFRYDTEKAEKLGEGWSDCGRGDFGYWEAGLYITPRAHRYFLAGEGGPMTSWRRRVGDSYTGGEGIIPLNQADALEWAERHLSTEEVEAGFGEVVEDA